jgi:NAD(P)-dependent dehydrogenase (short-subunit alcohol dehydrogenase family)
MQSKKRIIVTGANRGLGLETCRQLSELGHQVILTARDINKASIAAKPLLNKKFDIKIYSLDVVNPQSIDKFSSEMKKLGKIDCLINNAGVFLDNKNTPSVFDSEIDTIRQSMEVNVYGPLSLTQRIVPLMRGKGSIVNISSGMGQLSDMNSCCPGYRISKTALNALTRILSDELKDTSINVNSICPGWVKTDMGGINADRPIEEGVGTTVWLATNEDIPTGKFLRDKVVIPW